MLFVATVPAASSPCSAQEIAATAIVSPAMQQAPADVGLSRVDRGFSPPTVQEIRWHAPCTPNIVALYGGRTLATGSGLMLSMEGGSTLHVRHDPTPTIDPEPPHPEWKDHRFAGSAALRAGAWRVGAWVAPDGTTQIARYRAGDKATPITLMTSAQPIVGLFYLGLPDAVGGTLFFAQRLAPSHYRMVSMNWSEEGLRTPGR